MRLGSRTDSSCSSRCALGVAGFVRVRLFRYRALWPGVAGFIRVRLPWGLLCSYGLFWLVCVRPCCRCVRSSSSGSYGCTLCVAGFFRARPVRPGAPWFSFPFVQMRPEVRWVGSGSFCSFWFSLRVTGFVQVPQGSLGVPSRPLGSFRFILFVRVGAGGRWVRSGSSGSSGYALGVTGFFRVRLVCPGALWGSLAFVWFVMVRP